jgi:hypothetical protein
MHIDRIEYYLRSALPSDRFNLTEISVWYNWIGGFVCRSCDMDTGKGKGLPVTGHEGPEGE